MRRTLALLSMLALAALRPAAAQNRYVFGFTHTDDAAPADAVQLVTDQGVFVAALRGWFDDSGFHHPANDNYVLGQVDGAWYRDFFLFDFSGIRSTGFRFASLRVLNPVAPPSVCYVAPAPCRGYESPNGFDDVFFRYLDPSWYPSLGVRGSGRTDIFGAMGSGPVIGQRRFTAADNGTWVDVELNDIGLGTLNGRQGGLWGVGGQLAGDPGSVSTLTTTPEPARNRVAGYRTAAGGGVPAPAPFGLREDLTAGAALA